MLAAGAEWTAEAWAERASGDAAYNAEVRSRIANPLEFPLAAAIGFGIIVYAFSRIMLWLSKTNTVVFFAVMGVVIITVAFLLAYLAVNLLLTGVLGELIRATLAQARSAWLAGPPVRARRSQLRASANEQIHPAHPANVVQL